MREVNRRQALAGIGALGGAPIRASAVTLKDYGVVLEFALIGARYEGHLTDKDTLTGTFDPAKKIVAAAVSNEGGRAEVQPLISGLVGCAFLAAANS